MMQRLRFIFDSLKITLKKSLFFENTHWINQSLILLSYYIIKTELSITNKVNLKKTDGFFFGCNNKILWKGEKQIDILNNWYVTGLNFTDTIIQTIGFNLFSSRHLFGLNFLGHP